MFLQRLIEYSKRLKKLPPTLYSEAPVRYIIDLDRDGRLLSRSPTDTADPSSKSTRNGLRHPVPRVQRASGIRPLLLSDNGAYTLGLTREGKDPEREQACHEAYMEQLRRCAAQTQEPAVQAILAFYDQNLDAELNLPADLASSANITFRVGVDWAVDLPAVQAWWAAENATDAEGSNAPTMQCLACGQPRRVLERLQTKIKGIPGGQTTGTSLISANADAFESYGLQASLIAPICAPCAESMTRALNALLAEPTTHLILGDSSVFVCWTREETSFDFLNMLSKPDPADVKALLSSVYGKPAPSVEANRFYAALLSGSGGRAVLRAWIDATLPETKHNLAVWFQRQSIIGAWGDPHEPLGLYALAEATVRDRKEIAPPTYKALLTSALQGYPLPPNLLYQVVLRTLVGVKVQGTNVVEHVSRKQAALLKLVLLSQASASTKEDTMVELDVHNVQPAYLCGRLLAVLESAQRAAIPEAKATIVDRYYGTASTAPATVFGMLLQGAQSHLGKLERDKPGAYQAIQQRLEEVMAGLQSFPRVLNLQEQALFALGYYHQRAEHRAGIKAAVANKAAVAESNI